MERKRVEHVFDSVLINVASAGAIYVFAAAGGLVRRNWLVFGVSAFLVLVLASISFRDEWNRTGPPTWRTALWLGPDVVVIVGITIALIVALVRS